MRKINHIASKKTCHKWKDDFINDNRKYYKVRDNCRYTGKYKSTNHNVCNLRYNTPKENNGIS